MESTQIIEYNCDSCFNTNDDAVAATLLISDTAHTISFNENIIGRDPTCHVVINEKAISSKHASIEVDSRESHVIYDLGSSNKTRLGKTLLKPHIRYFLRDGDELTFANIKAIYKYASDSTPEKNSETKYSEDLFIPETPERKEESVFVPETPFKSLDNTSDVDIFDDPSLDRTTNYGTRKNESQEVNETTIHDSSSISNTVIKLNLGNSGFNEINNSNQSKIVEANNDERQIQSCQSIYDLDTQVENPDMFADDIKNEYPGNDLYNAETENIDDEINDARSVHNFQGIQMKNKTFLDDLKSESNVANSNSPISNLPRSVVEMNTQEFMCRVRDSDSENELEAIKNEIESIKKEENIYDLLTQDSGTVDQSISGDNKLNIVKDEFTTFADKNIPETPKKPTLLAGDEDFSQIFSVNKENLKVQTNKKKFTKKSIPKETKVEESKNLVDGENTNKSKSEMYTEPSVIKRNQPEIKNKESGAYGELKKETLEKNVNIGKNHNTGGCISEICTQPVIPVLGSEERNNTLCAQPISQKKNESSRNILGSEEVVKINENISVCPQLVVQQNSEMDREIMELEEVVKMNESIFDMDTQPIVEHKDETGTRRGKLEENDKKLDESVFDMFTQPVVQPDPETDIDIMELEEVVRMNESIFDMATQPIVEISHETETKINKLEENVKKVDASILKSNTRTLATMDSDTDREIMELQEVVRMNESIFDMDTQPIIDQKDDMELKENDKPLYESISKMCTQPVVKKEVQLGKQNAGLEERNSKLDKKTYEIRARKKNEIERHVAELEVLDEKMDESVSDMCTQPVVRRNPETDREITELENVVKMNESIFDMDTEAIVQNKYDTESKNVESQENDISEDTIISKVCPQPSAGKKDSIHETISGFEVRSNRMERKISSVWENIKSEINIAEIEEAGAKIDESISDICTQPVILHNPTDEEDPEEKYVKLDESISGMCTQPIVQKKDNLRQTIKGLEDGNSELEKSIEEICAKPKQKHETELEENYIKLDESISEMCTQPVVKSKDKLGINNKETNSTTFEMCVELASQKENQVDSYVTELEDMDVNVNESFSDMCIQPVVQKKDKLEKIISGLEERDNRLDKSAEELCDQLRRKHEMNFEENDGKLEESNGKLEESISEMCTQPVNQKKYNFGKRNLGLEKRDNRLNWNAEEICDQLGQNREMNFEENERKLEESISEMCTQPVVQKKDNFGKMVLGLEARDNKLDRSIVAICAQPIGQKKNEIERHITEIEVGVNMDESFSDMCTQPVVQKKDKLEKIISGLEERDNRLDKSAEELCDQLRQKHEMNFEENDGKLEESISEMCTQPVNQKKYKFGKRILGLEERDNKLNWSAEEICDQLGQKHEINFEENERKLEESISEMCTQPVVQKKDNFGKMVLGLEARDNKKPDRSIVAICAQPIGQKKNEIERHITEIEVGVNMDESISDMCTQPVVQKKDKLIPITSGLEERDFLDTSKERKYETNEASTSSEQIDNREVDMDISISDMLTQPVGSKTKENTITGYVPLSELFERSKAFCRDSDDDDDDLPDTEPITSENIAIFDQVTESATPAAPEILIAEMKSRINSNVKDTLKEHDDIKNGHEDIISELSSDNQLCEDDIPTQAIAKRYSQNERDYKKENNMLSPSVTNIKGMEKTEKLDVVNDSQEDSPVIKLTPKRPRLFVISSDDEEPEETPIKNLKPIKEESPSEKCITTIKSDSLKEKIESNEARNQLLNPKKEERNSNLKTSLLKQFEKYVPPTAPTEDISPIKSFAPSTPKNSIVVEKPSSGSISLRRKLSKNVREEQNITTCDSKSMEETAIITGSNVSVRKLIEQTSCDMEETRIACNSQQNEETPKQKSYKKFSKKSSVVSKIDKTEVKLNNLKDNKTEVKLNNLQDNKTEVKLNNLQDNIIMGKGKRNRVKKTFDDYEVDSVKIKTKQIKSSLSLTKQFITNETNNGQRKKEEVDNASVDHSRHPQKSSIETTVSPKKDKDGKMNEPTEDKSLDSNISSASPTKKRKCALLSTDESGHVSRGELIKTVQREYSRTNKNESQSKSNIISNSKIDKKVGISSAGKSNKLIETTILQQAASNSSRRKSPRGVAEIDKPNLESTSTNEYVKEIDDDDSNQSKETDIKSIEASPSVCKNTILQQAASKSSRRKSPRGVAEIDKRNLESTSTKDYAKEIDDDDSNQSKETDEKSIEASPSVCKNTILQQAASKSSRRKLPRGTAEIDKQNLESTSTKEHYIADLIESEHSGKRRGRSKKVISNKPDTINEDIEVMKESIRGKRKGNTGNTSQNDVDIKKPKLKLNQNEVSTYETTSISSISDIAQSTTNLPNLQQSIDYCGVIDSNVSAPNSNLSIGPESSSNNFATPTPPKHQCRANKRNFKGKVINQNKFEDVSTSCSHPGTSSDSDSNLSESSTTPNSRARKASIKKNQKVMFTHYNDSVMSTLVGTLGGEIVDDPLTCTVLVTDKVRRTVKFLCGMAKGVPIVSPNWLKNCRDSNCFTDPYKWLLSDKEAEEKFSFNLREGLNKSKQTSLLQGWSVFVTPSTKPPPLEIKSIVECSGGVFLKREPTSWSKNSFVISCPEDKTKWAKLKKKGVAPLILSAEVLLTGILQQKLNLKTYLLK